MRALLLALVAVTSVTDSSFAQLLSGHEARQERSAARAAAQPQAAVTGTNWLKLPLKATWQIQYAGNLDVNQKADVVDIDGFDTDPADVAALHRNGAKVICYISAGTYENWRPDIKRFPSAVLGGAVAGWAGERWLDIRRIDLLAPIMEARMDMCKAKGFDAVDPDNIDAFTNPTGLPLTYHDQLAYNRFLAKAAHDRGLAIGLKNDLDQVNELVQDFDFSVNEQCFQYKECNMLTPFVQAGKPVFNIEYKLRNAQFCGQALAMQFNSMRKRMSLDAWRQACE